MLVATWAAIGEHTGHARPVRLIRLQISWLDYGLVALGVLAIFGRPRV